MNQEERIFCGKLFNPRSKELKDLKHKAHVLCQKYNAMDEYDENRQLVIKDFIGAMGENCYLQGPIQFNYCCHTFIGNNVFANFNLTVLDTAKVFIGDNVLIGPNVSLMATSHPLIAQERVGMKDENGKNYITEYGNEIHIGNNVWIACNVLVFGGVTIGDGAVIGAGSVVTKDVPANHLAYGNPCKVIREITDKDSLKHLM